MAGATTLPAQLLRELDLTVRRRIDGLLAGDHRSDVLGAGTDLAQIRPYAPGDDVRRLDWNATARTRVPHVRVHVAERALTTWLVLDGSASMAWGTADRRKADVAHGAALAVAHAATRGVNRLGLLTFGGPTVEPPRSPAQGRVGLLHATRAVEAVAARVLPSGAASPAAEELDGALARLGRLARSRSLVVLVSDLRGGPAAAWGRRLGELGVRHDVVVVEVRDRREQALPAVGVLDLVDPETGRAVRVDTSSAKLRERFAAAAAAERAEVAAAVARSGAEHVVLSTEGDWLGPLARFLALRGRVARGVRVPA